MVVWHLLWWLIYLNSSVTKIPNLKKKIKGKKKKNLRLCGIKVFLRGQIKFSQGESSIYHPPPVYAQEITKQS